MLPGSPNAPYDAVIIGGGIGGLICASLLGLEGQVVCVLEKNKQLGGCLQTYARDKVIFDAGVHYIGSLAKGQTLYQIFKYLGIMDGLKLLRLSEDAFDKIAIGGEEREYGLAQGYERFKERLISDFPSEKQAIDTYCWQLKEVCRKFPMYNLRRGGAYSEKSSVLQTDCQTFVESITSDRTLQAVLCGNNILYAGQPDKTPFYVHALITNSFIESSWKCIGGGSQIAKLLSRNIRSQQGRVKTNAQVTEIVEENGLVTHVNLSDGTKIYGANFISSIHPAKTMEMTSSPLIRRAFKSRLKGLENSISCFSLNVVLKENAFPYYNYNYYYHKKGRLWSMAQYDPSDWPLGYAMFFSPSDMDASYSKALTIMTYMKFEEVEPWVQTFNTVSMESSRGASYEAFKEQKTAQLLNHVAIKFPQLLDCIQSVSSSTPLSLRDYLGTDDGSMYGYVKDYKDPVKTLVAARTKLPNLYLTGQNLNLHGILGVAISSLVTCSELLGDDSFIDRIKYA